MDQRLHNAAPPAFEMALDHHRRGELGSAQRLYDDVLRIDPQHADALHLLGVVLHQQNDHRRAVDTIKRAITADDSVALYYSNLGAAYRDLGERTKAIDSFQRAIEIDPEFAGAHYNLGMARQAEGLPDEAAACYRKALDCDREFVQAFNNLGLVLSTQEKFAEAAENFRRAIGLKPDFVEAYYNLANALHDDRQLEEAVVQFHQALKLNPQIAEIHNNLGGTLKELDRVDEAVGCFRTAIDLDEDYAEAHNNLGSALEFQGNTDAALDCYNRALERNPQFAGAHTNRGNVLNDMGHVDESLSAYDAALAVDPQLAEARFNRALVLIRNGDFEQGWAEYNWRFKRVVRDRHFTSPVWDGSSLSGKSILVYAEQGIGDEVMFASCLPDVIEQADHCVIECDRRLVGLFTRSYPSTQVVPRPGECELDSPDSFPGIDVQTAMGSLPAFFRKTRDAFPNRDSYLAADPQMTAAWKVRYAELGEGLKVGVSWFGGEQADLRRKRSTVLNDWRPVFSIPGIHFINLQYGSVERELAEVAHQQKTVIHHWPDADPLLDLDFFAAQISALDLVISVDNSTVHFAGALGTEVWTLLPFASDWRWGLDVETCPWYANMRLTRQSKPGCWQSVFAAIAHRLRKRGQRKRGQNYLIEEEKKEAELFDWTDKTNSSDPFVSLTPLFRNFNLGNVYLTQKKFDEATACFNAVLELDEGFYAAVHTNLGIAYQKAERLDEAEQCFGRAIAHDANYAQAHLNLGNVQKRLNRIDAAVASYRRVLEIDPENAEAWNNLGNILREQEPSSDAIDCYQRALQLNPEYSGAHNNLATLLHELDRPDEAITSYRRALAIDADFADALCNLGLVLMQQRNLGEAMHCFDRALDIEPGHNDARFYRATLRLLRGDFQNGWDEYEARWQRSDLVPRSYAQPTWDGSPIRDKTILIYPEQGIGDEIMFASCLTDMLDRAGQCLLECDPRLVGLFARSFPRAKVFAHNSQPNTPAAHHPSAAHHPFDVQIAAGSLPVHLRRSLDSFPNRSRYLQPDRQKQQQWISRLSQLGHGLKVGISWRGGRQHEDRRRRSIGLDHWSNILAVPGVCFVNLQYGNVQDELSIAKEQTGAVIHDWDDADPLSDLDNVAAEISALDLVISIDNATVHMAAALGVAVWTLLPVACDWRWQLEGDRSPWYSTMRLFRQSHSGDWCDVLSRVEHVLRQRVANLVRVSPFRTAPNRNRWTS